MSLAKREELVSELTSFYEFLVDLYLPSESLKRPPPGGWPSINQEQLDFLNKDHAVLEVLKHIPYIRRESPVAPYNIYESTVCNDFTGSYFERFSKGEKNVLRTEPSEEEIDSCVATLARPESTFGYWIFYHEARHTLQLVDYHDREFREKGVKEFFEMLKTEYRQMSVIATGPHRVYMVKRCEPEKVENLYHILRRNGWPSDNYRKRECMDEMSRAWPDLLGA